MIAYFVRTSTWIRALSLLLGALVLGSPALAVELNATVKGVVTDTSGLTVPGVTVTLTAPELLGARSATTDEEGRFRFTALPPGTYSVRAEKDRFRDWASPEIRLAVGSTLIVDIALYGENEGDFEVLVVDERPAVDVESTRTGAVLQAEMLANLPSGRDYQSAMTIVPGVVGGGNANMHGGFDTSNQFYIDGVNTTDPVTNTFSLNMNYDAIDSIQVLTGGMDAEYGRALGGAVNIVTKSGGNQFSGSANLIYAPNWGVIAPKKAFDTDDRNLSEQLALNLGGPILKDKVWFFASLQGDRSIDTTNVDPAVVGRDLDRYPMQPRDFMSAYWFAKVTAQPSTAHRVWLHLQGDPTRINNVEQNPYTLPSGETYQDQGGWLSSLGHTFTPNDAILLENQIYLQSSYIEYASMLWRDCEDFDDRGACTEDFVGETYAGQPVPRTQLGWNPGDFNMGELSYAYLARRYRASANTNLSVFFDFLGEHKVKTGAQVEYLFSKDAFPGSEVGDPYYTVVEGGNPNNPEDYEPVALYRYESDLTVQLSALMGSFYVQDVYKPHPKLTLRPGVRFDYTGMRSPDEAGNPETAFSRITTSPRMGLAYDFTGEGTTAAHAYYGRFYDAGFLVIADLLKRQGGGGYGQFSWDPQAGDWSTVPDFTVASTFLQHELKNPYSDEFNVGLTQQVGKRTQIDGTLIYEEAHRFWEDDEVNLIWNDAGTDVIGSRNGTSEAIYRIRTPSSAYTQYTSFELSLFRSFDAWTVLGSYTWAHAWGTQSSDQATGNLDVPEQREQEVGYLAYDRRHAVKVAGNWVKDDLINTGKLGTGFVLGWNYQSLSGTPYRPLVFNDFLGSYSNYNRPGDQVDRLPWLHTVDVRAALHFDYAKKANWTAGVDVFNLFNSRQFTSVNTEFDPSLTGADQTYGDPLDHLNRRRLQFVVRGSF